MINTSKKILLLLTAFLCFSALFAQDIKELQKKLEAQDQRIKELEKKLKGDGTPDKNGVVTEDKLNQMIDKYLDDKLGDPKGFKLPVTLKSKWIQFGGVAEVEFIDYRERKIAGLANPQTHFKFDKAALSIQVHFHEYVKLVSVFEFDKADDGTKVDKVYAQFHNKNLLNSENYKWGADLKIGINSVPYKLSRKTERYPMVGTSFYRDEEIGVQFRTNFNFFFLGFDFTQARELDDAHTGEDSSDSTGIIQDDRHDGKGQREHLVRFSLGVKEDFKEYGKIFFIAFWENSKLDDGDLSFLGGLSDYALEDPELDDDNKNLWGVLADYNLPTKLGTKGELGLQGAFLSDRAGELRRHGYYMQASHKWKLGFDFFQSITPIVRYGRYQVGGITTDNANPLTFDREEVTLSLLLETVKNMTFKIEYTFEDAFRKNAKDLDLDYLGITLEAKF